MWQLYQPSFTKYYFPNLRCYIALILILCDHWPNGNTKELTPTQAHTDNKQRNKPGRGSNNLRSGWGQNIFCFEEESVYCVRDEKLSNLPFPSISWLITTMCKHFTPFFSLCSFPLIDVFPDSAWLIKHSTAYCTMLTQCYLTMGIV